MFSLVSILQAEFSLTRGLDRPVLGRVFFEEVIRDNLDPGPPTGSGSLSHGKIIILR